MTTDVTVTFPFVTSKLTIAPGVPYKVILALAVLQTSSLSASMNKTSGFTYFTLISVLASSVEIEG